MKIADRIDALLQAQLGQGIDLQRMLAEPLYARDVLLVCDSHRGHELAELARYYRLAAAEMVDDPKRQQTSSGFGGATSDFMSSLFDGFKPSEPSSLPGATLDAARQAEVQRRARAWYSPARWRGEDKG
jgi:hypothetical protein